MDEQSTNTEAVQESTEHVTEVPAELQGLPEDIVKETMEKAGVETKEESGTAEADSDNKQVAEESKDDDEDVLPDTQIPYKRFKAKVDRVKELEAELKELRGKIDKGAQNNFIPVQPKETPKNSLPQQPLDDKTVAILKEATKQSAMQISGMTQDDVDALEYLEDDDPRVAKWKYAQDMARNTVMNNYQRLRKSQEENVNRFISNHKAAVADYNAFVQTEMSSKDFENVKNYAVNDFFNNLPDNAKSVIAESYARIERNTASPQDIFVIKNYFTEAKRSYQNGTKKPGKAATSKVQQANALPRASQVNGTSGEAGAVTEETLAKMLHDMPFEKIPKEYQDMLLSGRIG